jgi:hypothetical protein
LERAPGKEDEEEDEGRVERIGSWRVGVSVVERMTGLERGAVEEADEKRRRGVGEVVLGWVHQGCGSWGDISSMSAY